MSQERVRHGAKLIESNRCTPQVSIIISGRNSEKFLRETIDSVFSQKGIPPIEIIYSDDCSDDSSAIIASEYISRGLIVLLAGTHQGVCAARNKGASYAKADWLIFMDTDDTLPPDYVKTMLSDLETVSARGYARTETVPFIYPSTKCFGDADTLWTNMPWNAYDKWVQNQVSTTAMWNRAVFYAAGQWQDMKTMWDYDLALRCSKFGEPYAGKAILNYRIHDASQSAQLNERFRVRAIPHQEFIRRKNATLGIGCLVSGRLPHLFPKWISKLSQSVRYASAQKVKLYLLLHTEAQRYLSHYQSESLHYSDTFDVQFGFINDKVSKTTEFDRRQSVCRLLANGCQNIQDTLQTDLVWLVEDDICVPIEACDYLLSSVTQDANPPIGVSGSYYNRHPAMAGRLLGGWIMNGKHCEPTTPFRPQDVVDFVGTGCLMYWPYRPGSPKQWRPISKLENATAHDWAWSEDVKGILMVDGRVICDHHITVEEFV